MDINIDNRIIVTAQQICTSNNSYVHLEELALVTWPGSEMLF